MEKKASRTVVFVMMAVAIEVGMAFLMHWLVQQVQLLNPGQYITDQDALMLVTSYLAICKYSWVAGAIIFLTCIIRLFIPTSQTSAMKVFSIIDAVALRAGAIFLSGLATVLGARSAVELARIISSGQLSANAVDYHMGVLFGCIFLIVTCIWLVDIVDLPWQRYEPSNPLPRELGRMAIANVIPLLVVAAMCSYLLALFGIALLLIPALLMALSAGLSAMCEINEREYYERHYGHYYW